MTELITKKTLKEKVRANPFTGFVKNPVSLVTSRVGLRGVRHLDDKLDHLIDKSKDVTGERSIQLSGRYESGFDVPIFDNGKASFRDMVRRQAFSGNNLPQNWTDFLDALRLDLTIRKQAEPTIRQFIYEEVTNPNFTKDVRPTELNPYGVVFEENNGTGQSVRQGANMGGSSTTVPMKIYAAGYAYTLLASLFDGSWDLGRLNDGVALGYAAKRDDIAIAPILAGTYAGAKATAASSEGDSRQEKLYNTLWDAVDDLAVRTDPVTKRRLGATDMVILASEFDAPHIDHVLNNGQLPSDRNRKYGPIPAITRVLGYDGEVIDTPNETITYTGVSAGTAFLIKRSRYFKIAIKRGLVAEVDMTPDVTNLTQEERAWYFVEALYNSEGINSFVQKVTLPTW